MRVGCKFASDLLKSSPDKILRVEYFIFKFSEFGEFLGDRRLKTKDSIIIHENVHGVEIIYIYILDI